MNIQCTANLLKKLKIKPALIDDTNITNVDIENWHSNILTFGDIDTILITHDKTLFSLFIVMQDESEFKFIDEIFKESFLKILFDLGFPQKQVEIILKSLENINYSKTSNRRITASMNEMKKHIVMNLDREKSVFEINKSLNSVMYSYIEYKKPINKFKELLEKV